MPELVTICEKAARTGGSVLLSWMDRFETREKGPKDLVTDADLASQQAIRDIVLGEFPDHEFLGEEDDALDTKAINSPRADTCRWLVDPLDGTTNYVHRLPMFSVSVAVERGGEILAGAVFDPIASECYTAQSGQGAWLNGAPLSTSNCERISEALLAASFSANVPRNSDEVVRFVEVLHSCQALRRMGSAALNLSYLAAGRLDGYWATSVKPWDVAAGILLVREAGGIATGVDGGPLDLARPKFAAAATPTLHKQLVGLLRADDRPPAESTNQ